MRRQSILLLALPLVLGGCGSLQKAGDWFASLHPYRIEIVQGNVVTKEQIARIQPGMTRLQVRDVLGTPLLTDAFHADRWDYLFTLRRPGVDYQRRDVVLHFDGDRLLSVEAPELPTEQEFIASITTRKDFKVPKLELTPEQLEALPVPQRAAAAQAASEPAAAPPRNYPPLDAS
ncbi:MAG: outer membrane protein assembly factor BamE [Burkholderiales bacterium]|nr:outer membrane protein assembly factor BamE [Burkholderiales bacterium]MDE2396563.1 outer membrane protein assembly factor BamE [Burkholderiales bacterium]MDE2453681.1 outer membrane protein assembly factor BamE [Burkholderiales bacterium]